MDFGFNKEEIKTIKKLHTPVKIQEFLNSLEINFEENGETCMSPRMVLRTKKAHCIEAAMFAAATASLAAAFSPTTTLVTGAPFALTNSVLPNIKPAKATELANIVAPATIAPIFLKFTFIFTPQIFYTA